MGCLTSWATWPLTFRSPRRIHTQCSSCWGRGSCWAGETRQVRGSLRRTWDRLQPTHPRGHRLRARNGPRILVTPLGFRRLHYRVSNLGCAALRGTSGIRLSLVGWWQGMRRSSVRRGQSGSTSILGAFAPGVFRQAGDLCVSCQWGFESVLGILSLVYILFQHLLFSTQAEPCTHAIQSYKNTNTTAQIHKNAKHKCPLILSNPTPHTSCTHTHSRPFCFSVSLSCAIGMMTLALAFTRARDQAENGISRSGVRRAAQSYL